MTVAQERKRMPVVLAAPSWITHAVGFLVVALITRRPQDPWDLSLKLALDVLREDIRDRLRPGV